MVVIGADFGGAPAAGRQGVHGQAVGVGFHARPQAGEFGMHGVDAVRFLDPPTGDVAQPAGAVGVQGQHGGGHGGVGNQVEVPVEGPEPLALGHHAAPHHQGAGLAFHPGAHGLDHFGEGHVALDAVAADAFDADRAARDGAQPQEVRGGRGVAFDTVAPRGAVARVGGDGEAFPALAPHPDAETFHQVQRDQDVRSGDQRTVQLDDHIAAGTPGGDRRGHQQRRQELAGHGPAHPDRPARIQASSADAQRRIAVPIFIRDFAAQAAQGIDQVSDGPFVHARHAGQPILATHHRQDGRQRPEGRARVAQKQVGTFLRPVGGAVQAHPARAGLAQIQAQGLQSRAHDPRVVGIQQAVQLGRSFGQRRQQQRPVRNAFGAWQRHRAARMRGRFQAQGRFARVGGGRVHYI